LRAVAVVPLSSGGENVGVIWLSYVDEAREFRDN